MTRTAGSWGLLAGGDDNEAAADDDGDGSEAEVADSTCFSVDTKVVCRA